MNESYIFYGTKCHPEELVLFISHLLKTNAQIEAQGNRKVPLCIWGQHGIGKTEIVETYAKENNYQFAYIAPAQFEEMGDLLGMPQITQQKDTSAQTQFIAPEWVPTHEGPGILLIDDVNRADDRILRGIMQLLQNYELVSWKLPPKWNIILTANPDGGDYSVTPLDMAMITRMMHVSLTFDVKRWAKWAEKKQVDSRGISFVLTYPEVITGERTTPRTLVQFFENIASIPDLKENIGLVKMLADACLDSTTVTAFISFINNDLSKLITPEMIVDATDFQTEVYEPIKNLVEQQTKRVDILAVITTRLINFLNLSQQRFKDNQIENIKHFLKMDFLPNDIRLVAAQDMMENDHVKTLWADPELGQILLDKM